MHHKKVVNDLRGLPPNYEEQQEIQYYSSAPAMEMQREWLISLGIRHLSVRGSTIMFVGARDALLAINTLAKMFPRRVFVLDHGYLRSALSNLCVFREWDTGPVHEHSVVDLLVVLDVVGESPVPELYWQQLNRQVSSTQMVLVVPDRATQKNENDFGPPKAYFRIREWDDAGLRVWLENLGQRVLGVARLRQYSGRERMDLVALTTTATTTSRSGDEDWKCLLKDIVEGQQENSVKVTEPDSIRGTSTGDTFFPKGLNRARSDLGLDIDAKQLEGIIGSRLACREPFGLMRVGHGEARLLGWPRYFSPIWALRSVRVGAGQLALGPRALVLRRQIAEALSEASVVGIPDELSKDDQWRLALTAVEAAGVQLSGRMLTSQNCHLDLLESGALERLIEIAGGATFVGSRSLVVLAKARFPDLNFDEIHIPGETKFDSDAQIEWSQADNLQPICEELAAGGRSLVLIGAGLYGKPLCKVAMDAGAVALDIGSVFDVWGGFSTRTTYSPKFLRSHSWSQMQ